MIGWEIHRLTTSMEVLFIGTHTILMVYGILMAGTIYIRIQVTGIIQYLRFIVIIAHPFGIQERIPEFI